MADIYVDTGIEVQIVTKSDQVVVDLARLALPDESPATLIGASDVTLKDRAARYLDREADEFRDYSVSRPAEGRIMIFPQPVFGS